MHNNVCWSVVNCGVKMRKSIILPTSVLSIKNFLVNSIVFFLPIYFANIGFSGLQIGILLSVFAVTSLFSSFLAGLFSDRYPIKYISVFSFFLLMIYLFGLSSSVNFFVVLILFFIGGLGNDGVTHEGMKKKIIAENQGHSVQIFTGDVGSFHSSPGVVQVPGIGFTSPAHQGLESACFLRYYH